jgi:hypothetical protein
LRPPVATALRTAERFPDEDDRADVPFGDDVPEARDLVGTERAGALVVFAGVLVVTRVLVVACVLVVTGGGADTCGTVVVVR